MQNNIADSELVIQDPELSNSMRQQVYIAKIEDAHESFRNPERVPRLEIEEETTFQLELPVSATASQQDQSVSRSLKSDEDVLASNLRPSILPQPSDDEAKVVQVKPHPQI